MMPDLVLEVEVSRWRVGTVVASEVQVGMFPNFRALQ